MRAIFPRQRGFENSLRRATAGFCLALALLVCAAGAPAAQQFGPRAQETQFEQAVASLKRGDYALALEAFERLAGQGHLAAQYDAGWMRARGLGAPVDYIAAYQWFALVARAGEEKGVNALRELRQRMAAADIAEGELRADRWRPAP